MASSTMAAVFWTATCETSVSFDWHDDVWWWIMCFSMILGKWSSTGKWKFNWYRWQWPKTTYIIDMRAIRSVEIEFDYHGIDDNGPPLPPHSIVFIVCAIISILHARDFSVPDSPLISTISPGSGPLFSIISGDKLTIVCRFFYSKCVYRFIPHSVSYFVFVFFRMIWYLEWLYRFWFEDCWIDLFWFIFVLMRCSLSVIFEFYFTFEFVAVVLPPATWFYFHLSFLTFIQTNSNRAELNLTE